MHLHILGICGTFMGGVAALAREAGHQVTGCDEHVYPPMSTQLAELGIEVIRGWNPGQLDLAPDLFVVGNVVSRGNPLLEAILSARAPYTSGPQWLGEHILAGRRPVAVAGTHGKTTTAAMLAWILESCGQSPGFLIGGVVPQLGLSARLGESDWFVVEADEYDTAFSDKRAKFVHYRPEVALLNNLEFDHADIYPDLAAIEWQFHQLLRVVPASGRVVVNAADASLARVLQRGCWSEVVRFDTGEQGSADWQAWGGGGQLRVRGKDGEGVARWALAGEHNLANAAAAVAAASVAGVATDDAVQALGQFDGVKRRLEHIGTVNGAEVFDDFAHHPTAIRTTLAGVREQAPGRVIAVFEPRSNTMRAGVHRDTLAPALALADEVLVLRSSPMEWDIDAALATLGSRVQVFDDVAAVYAAIDRTTQPGDTVVLMSNGSFGGLRERLAGLEAVA